LDAQVLQAELAEFMGERRPLTGPPSIALRGSVFFGPRECSAFGVDEVQRILR
jgi:hypothetical protein